jgi:hypothetical protein
MEEAGIEQLRLVPFAGRSIQLGAAFVQNLRQSQRTVDGSPWRLICCDSSQTTCSYGAEKAGLAVLT